MTSKEIAANVLGVIFISAVFFVWFSGILNLTSWKYLSRTQRVVTGISSGSFFLTLLAVIGYCIYVLVV